MSGIHNFQTFILAAILLIITPGNDTLFILGRSMAQGQKAGVLSVLGISAGSLVHTILAAFGLSMVIAKSDLAFQVVKYSGAAYLCYMGVRMLLDRSKLDFAAAAMQDKGAMSKVFRDALITNVLNPKVALFFIAFLPQFIDPAYRENPLPFLILGVSFTAMGVVWCLMLAIFAARFFARLRDDQSFAGYMNKACGAIFVALALRSH